MYLAVTPLIHSIRGVEQFTYRSPDELTVQRGQVVVIPWRSHTIMGVVVELAVAPFAKAKLVSAVTDIILPLAYLNLLEWFARYYAISRAHAFQLALPELPRSVVPNALPELPKTEVHEIVHKSIPAELEARIQKVIQTLPSHGASTIVYTQRRDAVACVEALLSQLATWPCAVIVPEEVDVTDWQKSLESHQPVIVTSQLGRGPLRQAWCTMLARRRYCYLGTKRLSLFPLTELRRVIVIDPEESSHKQWDMNPRYHVQRITDYLADHTAVPVTYFSYAPRLEQFAHHQLNIDLLNDAPKPSLRCIAMDQQYMVSWQVLERLEQAQLPVIWYQRKGKYQLMICRACSTISNDITLAQCSTCGSADLIPRGFGTTTLVEYLRTKFPERPVLEITKDQTPVTIPYDAQPIIVATTAMKHRIDWDKVDYGVVVSVDHVLGLANFRAHETVYQQLVWLRNHVTHLDIQTYAPDHEVFVVLQQRWPAQWYEHTWQQRQAFHYPPAADYIALRHTKTRATQFIRSLAALPADPYWIIDREL